MIPLHNACSFGHAEVVRTLLRHGADPNSRDNWNYTPLHEAAVKGKVDVCVGESLFQNFFCAFKILPPANNIRVIVLTVLLQHGADPNIRNTDGKTALDVAETSAKLVLTGWFLQIYMYSMLWLTFFFG